MTRERVVSFKHMSPCKICDNCEHWYGNQKYDGFLSRDTFNSLVSTVDKNLTVKNPSTPNATDIKGKRRRSFTFYKGIVARSPKNIWPVGGIYFLSTLLSIARNGLLISSEAPYSAIGVVGFAVVAALVVPNWNITLDPLPPVFRNCWY